MSQKNNSAMEELGLGLMNAFSKLEKGDIEICIDDVQEMKMVYEQTDFSVSTSSHITTYGIRAIVDNRVGFITTNHLDKSNIKDIVQEVQNIARLSPRNEYYQVADKSTGSFELYDHAIGTMAPKDLLNHADYFISECRRDPRVLIDRAEISLSNETRFIFNNKGVNQSAKQSLCNWYVMGMASENGEVTSFDYDGDAVSDASKIHGQINQTAKNFRESVIGSLGAKGCQSYEGSVLLHPAAVAHLLGGIVAFNVNGRAQQDGMSSWKGKQGEKIAHENLTLRESPLDKSRPGSWTPFDREGLPTQDRDIIKNGVLKLTAHNLFSAARGKTSPTGHATGGSRSTPGIGLHAMSFEKGNTSEKDLYAALGKGLVVKRFSGNEDPVSGVFSGIAKNSWWVENGKRTQSIKEVMVAGNSFELLKNIKLIGADITRLSGQVDAPYILIEGLSVTG